MFTFRSIFMAIIRLFLRSFHISPSQKENKKCHKVDNAPAELFEFVCKSEIEGRNSAETIWLKEIKVEKIWS